MNNTVQVLIVEDEPIWAKQLELHVLSLGYSVANIFTNAADALVNIEKTNFDIALLDIRMNGLNAGIAIGKMVNQMLDKPFIFISSGNDKETLDEAIAAMPSAFLIKPVNEKGLYVAIQTALDNFAKNKSALAVETLVNNESFFVKVGKIYQKLEWKEVVALTVEGRYTKVIMNKTNEQFLIGSSLNKTWSIVVPKNWQPIFVQINRTEMINSQYIMALKGDEVVCDDKVFIVSENYMQGLKQVLPIV